MYVTNKQFTFITDDEHVCIITGWSFAGCFHSWNLYTMGQLEGIKNTVLSLQVRLSIQLHLTFFIISINLLHFIFQGTAVGSLFGFVFALWIGIGSYTIKRHLDVLPTPTYNCTAHDDVTDALTTFLTTMASSTTAFPAVSDTYVEVPK